VKGQHVQTTATTAFIGGIKADLLVGMKVEAEGQLVGGVLIATKVMFKDNIRIDAIVSAANVANTATTGDITLLGKKVVITSATDLRGLSGTTLDLTTVKATQEVQIRGIMSADGNTIIATRVDLIKVLPDAATFKQFLRGPVTAKGTGTLTIAGITVNIGTGTSLVDNKVPPNPVADLLTKVIPNSTAVKVTWDKGVTDTTLPAIEAELET